MTTKKLRIMLPGGVVHAQQRGEGPGVGSLDIEAVALCGQLILYPALTDQGVTCRKCLRAIETVDAARDGLNVFGQARNVPASSPTEAELLHIAAAARRWITIRRLMAKRLENLGRPTEEILGDMRLTLIAESVGERDLDEALKAVGL